LEENSHTAIFVDRRVDPTQRIDLSIENATPLEILEKVATTHALGVAQLDTLIYLGPERTAGELSALAALRRSELTRLTPEEQHSLLKRDAVTWPRLTEPRDLVVQFLQDRGWQIEGSEQVPFDLWAAGELPTMATSDSLTALLVGFDLTFRTLAGKRTIEIIPIAEAELANRPTAGPSAAAIRSAQLAKKNTTQRYTLRVQEQPVGKVLDQLARQLHLEVKADAAAIEAAGRSMEKRVSFEVKDADLTALLYALLHPAGLTYERDGDQLKISPL
jgi:hypothetical protein